MRSDWAIWARTMIISRGRSSACTATWERTKTRELPIVEALCEAPDGGVVPLQRHTGIVHSDYRFGNAMIDASGRLVAVLDWELCAIGDVLVDVGLLVNNWDEPTDPAPGVWMQEAPTRSLAVPNARADRRALCTADRIRDS